MKIFFVLFLLIVSNSCSEKSTGEQLSGDTVSASENTDDLIPTQVKNPSEIILTAEVLQSFDVKMDICGQEKNNVVSIRVNEIRSHGQGIVNLPIKNQELLVQFLVLNEKLEEDAMLELIAKESLCSNASDTYLSVLRHQVLE